jgi:hypothetical protein
MAVEIQWLGSCPSVSVWDWFQDPQEYQNSQCLSPLYKNSIVFVITYSYPLVYFKTSLGYL